MANKQLKSIKFPGLDDTYTIPQTAEEITYDSSASSHASGSTAAAIASHSSQIEELQNDLTNKTASTSDIGKIPIVKAVSNGKVSEWEFGTGARKVYGFHIDGSESDPSTAVTYLEDAVGMTPAAMNFTTGVFCYGSWENAFFMPRPCMLKYDGTVDYYLDPDDYTKKEDGTTASDVADDTYGGNAMMEWGQNGKKIWLKVVPDTDPKSGSVYIADYQADDDFKAWSFINTNGVLVDHFYTPIYNGYLDSNSKLRSLSGKVIMNNKDSGCSNASQEVAYARNNGAIWNVEVFCDITLINFLLVLISKSLDTQTKFGVGRANQSYARANMIDSGTMNTNGLFYGSSSTTATDQPGVKVFGMENYWGNQWRRFAGLINDNGNVKYKLCYGKTDGSTVDDYNTTGSGYISSGVTPSGTSGSYISEFKFVEDGVLIPKVASGSASTYACDRLWFNNAQINYAYRGGACSDGLACGACYLSLHDTASGAHWYVGAAPSCKPLSA